MSITEVRLRLATQEESTHAKGNILYRALSIPFDIVEKALGTWEIYSKGPNTLAWHTPVVTTLFNHVKWLSGYAPEWPFIRHLPNFIGTFHYVEADPKLLKEVLYPHRNNEMFTTTRWAKTLLETISKAFPSIREEDFILTCSPEATHRYRAQIMRMFNGTHMKKDMPIIAEEVGQTLNDWAERSAKGEQINATVETRIFASRVITRLLLGFPTGDKELSSAVNFINQYIVKRFSRTVTEKDEEDFKDAISKFRESVNDVIRREDEAPIFTEQQGDLTLEQKQALIFTLFFAGQETVAALLAYILLKLGKNPDLEPNEQLYHDALREFPPAYEVSRLINNDLCLEFQVEGDPNLHKLVMFKGEYIIARMIEVAKRENTVTSSDKPWKPFGAGTHRCPGEQLAAKEVQEFLRQLSDFKIHVDQTKELKLVGSLTTQFDEDVMISVTPR